MLSSLVTDTKRRGQFVLLNRGQLYQLLLRRRMFRAVGHACSNRFNFWCLYMKFHSSDTLYVFVMTWYNVLISWTNCILKVKDNLVHFEVGMVFSLIFFLYSLKIVYPHFVFVTSYYLCIYLFIVYWQKRSVVSLYSVK